MVAACTPRKQLEHRHASKSNQTRINIAVGTICGPAGAKRPIHVTLEVAESTTMQKTTSSRRSTCLNFETSRGVVWLNQRDRFPKSTLVFFPLALPVLPTALGAGPALRQNPFPCPLRLSTSTASPRRLPLGVKPIPGIPIVSAPNPSAPVWAGFVTLATSAVGILRKVVR